MNNLETYSESIFENIKHIDEFGNEYWDARELMPLLEYSKWENFHKVIKRAMLACETSNNNVSDHFPEFRKTIAMPKGASKTVVDYKLSRYACYLIVQTAKDAGVANFGKFNNYGYKGLYNGETAKQIAKRKSINQNEDILDYMGSEELGANLFRITQTEAKLKKDSVDNEKDACLTHYHVGKTVRKAIQELGGNMPETLSTPEKSIRELEKEELQRIGTNP